MSENSHVISKEDSKRLVELLDEAVKILKDLPSDEIERLKNIHEVRLSLDLNILKKMGVIIDHFGCCDLCNHCNNFFDSLNSITRC